MNHGLGTGYRATTTFGLYLEKYGSNRSQSAGIRTSTFDGFGLHASKFGFVHSPRQSRRDAQQQTLCMRLNIPTGRPGCTCLWLHRKTGGILPSIGITSQRPKCRRDEQGHQLNLPRPRNQCPSRLVKDGCQGSGVVMSSRRRACSSNSLDEQSLQLGQKTVVPTPCAIVLRHTQH